MKKANTPAVQARPRQPGSHLINIEWLIARGGAIHIGCVGSMECVAAAADRDRRYAMLAQREGESVLALLCRLDRSIEQVIETAQPIDEVNS